MIDLNGLKLKNRFLASASSLNYGYGYWHERWCTRPSTYGAVTTKTITLDAREGHYSNKHRPWEVIRPIKGGWINALGWYNCGIDQFIEEHYPKTKGINLIVSIGGFAPDEYLQLITRLSEIDIAGIEINLSCPNVDSEIVEKDKLCGFFYQLRQATNHPLILKLGFEQDYQFYADAAENARFNAVHAINTITGLRLNHKSGQPWLNNKTGGVSGSIIKPLALRVVHELSQSCSLPIIGGGGINNLRDCDEFRHAGASSFCFGSIHLVRPWWPSLIIWLSRFSKNRTYWHGN